MLYCTLCAHRGLWPLWRKVLRHSRFSNSNLIIFFKTEHLHVRQRKSKQLQLRVGSWTDSRQIMLQVCTLHMKRMISSVTATNRLHHESEYETDVFHFLFWACGCIFVLRETRCAETRLCSDLVYTGSFLLSYKLRLRILLLCVGVCCRAGSSQVSVRCERHSLVCDSAVDRGGSGGLLPGPL